ncbi:MAG: Zn-dependent exopeptidase M28 [Propioniciclava sp.]|nr:Zn-dependent exopeptidase M28 [Propioniciclava sp.]
MTEPSTPEARLLSQVSGSRLMDSTRSIARWVRLSGEPDELASFEWVKARLEEYGFETELTHHRAYISLPGPAVLRVAGHDREVTGISHAFATSTPTGGLSGRLVDARSADAAGAADAFAGKIVLVDGMASGVSVRTWEDRGTIAQVHVHDDHLHETSVSPVWGNPTEQGLELMPRTPGLAIRRSDAAWLRELMSGGPIEVTIHTEVLTEWRPIPLLTAALPAAPAEPYVLLSSHIDSWYYGAMDNGSANATTLEVARILAENAGELRRGLRVAFWSGHSHGRFAGSAWYADDRWLDLHEHCVAHVFVDSTGGKGATVVTEAPVMPQTKGLAAAAVKAVTGEEFDGKRIGRFADQSFYAIGLNSVFGTLSEQEASGASDTISFKTGGKRAGGLGWWWHTPDDTVDKVDEAFLVRDTKIYLAALHRLLTAPRLPFDYRPAIEEVAATLGSRAKASARHLDTTGLLRDAADAHEAIHRFHEALDRAGREADEVANRALLRLSRHLVPLAFHESGRFERDLAEPLVPVPSLRDLERLAGLPEDDAVAHAMATRLHRTINRVRFGLRNATRVAREAQQELTAVSAHAEA